MTVNVVAIDGPAGSGKSTVARALADKLRWSYLDTGAMYRAVAYAALARGIDTTDDDLVGSLAETVHIETVPDVVVDGENVQALIRTPAINLAVSTVSTLPRVRRAMVAQQRNFARRQSAGTVVEGRDTTTVVFPDARLKIFLTASLEIRANRRNDEEISSIQRRDDLDSKRSLSPLMQAPDAYVVDTTNKPISDVVEEILLWMTPTDLT